MKAKHFRVAAFLLLALVPAVHGAPATKAAKARPPQFFDPTVERLPSGFAGSDFGALFKARSTIPKKGEFETSDQYRERLKAVSGDGFYSVALDLFAQYDADRQRFTVLILTKELQTEAAILLNRYGDRPVLVVNQTRKESGKYVGSNAFGVRTKVTKVNMIEDAIVLGNPHYDDVDDRAGARNFYIPLPSDRARATMLAFLLVFKPEPIGGAGLTTTASSYKDPTLDFPLAVTTTARYLFVGDAVVWAYDKRTGEVLGKFKLGMAGYGL